MSKRGDGIRTFKGAVALVTGGASGIGRALGAELARRGAEVVLADINMPQAQQAAAEIIAQGGKAQAEHLDVTDFSAVEKSVRDVFNRQGRLDYIFNNAGIGVCGEMRDFALEHWTRVLDVNLMGVIHGIQAAYPLMLGQGFGHIVNTSSMSGLLPTPLVGSYTASKFAVVGLSLALRIEAQNHGVRVSAICPGVIDTPILIPNESNFLFKQVKPEDSAAMWRQTFPMDPNRFARKVLNLVARNKAIIIAPSWWKILWWMYRLTPGPSMLFFKRQLFDNAKRQMAKLEQKAKKDSC